jgi:single-strand DNA-binding protein
MSLANISIVGNLVKPPEQMHFVSGKIKTTFTVAVNGFGRPARGGDTADFYRVETWGKLAELAAKYLDKGNQIAVSGRLLFDRFVDQQGKNRVIPVVEANQLSLPPKPKANNNGAEGDENADMSEAGAEKGVPVSGQILMDDQNNTIEEIFAGSVVAENADADFNLVEIDNKVKAKSKRLEKVAIGQ